jgi:hypothetical protein
MIFGRSFNFWFVIPVTSFNSFFTPLWNITTSFGLILGYSNHFKLLMWPTSTFFLQNLLHSFFHTSCQYCWHTVIDYQKVVIYKLFWFFIFICQINKNKPMVCFGIIK